MSQAGRTARAVRIAALLLLVVGAFWLRLSVTEAPVEDVASLGASEHHRTEIGQGSVTRRADAFEVDHDDEENETGKTYAEVNVSVGEGPDEGTGELNTTVIHKRALAFDAGVTAQGDEGTAERVSAPGSPALPMGTPDDTEQPSTLEMRAYSEARDDAWATDAEKQIAAAFVDTEYGELRDLRCGATLCAFALDREGDVSSDFVQDAVSGIPWQASSWVRPQGDTLHVVMAREGRASDGTGSSAPQVVP